ncbi:transglycosylase SLT domain-containing protein [Nitrospira calida]|jgi:hypothetical protein
MRRLGLVLMLIGAMAAPGAPARASIWADWPVPCLAAVAREARLSRSLLQAIVWVESRGHPWALHVNGSAGGAVYPSSLADARARLGALLRRGANVDIGLAQINSRHLPRLGLQAHQLLEPCTNLRAGARILNELLARHGETWRAIMRYNGRDPAYAHRIREAWRWFRSADRAAR